MARTTSTVTEPIVVEPIIEEVVIEEEPVIEEVAEAVVEDEPVIEEVLTEDELVEELLTEEESVIEEEAIEDEPFIAPDPSIDPTYAHLEFNGGLTVPEGVRLLLSTNRLESRAKAFDAAPAEMARREAFMAWMQNNRPDVLGKTETWDVATDTVTVTDAPPVDNDIDM